MTKLCPHLGKTLAELADMPETELALWEALDDRIETIGPARLDALAALICVSVARAAGNSKLKFEDCLLFRDSAEQSEEEMQAILAAAIDGR